MELAAQRLGGPGELKHQSPLVAPLQASGQVPEGIGRVMGEGDRSEEGERRFPGVLGAELGRSGGLSPMANRNVLLRLQ